jgi:hypothetical protein
MKHGIHVSIVGTVAMAGLSLNAVAGLNSNPYEVIVVRNPFGLRPIPVIEPTKPPTTPAPPLPEIKITGITTLLGAPKALFQYEDKEAKRLEFPSPLSEGESYKVLMVVSIDSENGRVCIKNGDTEMTLDFVNNGVKLPATAVALLPMNAAPVAVGNPGGPASVSGPAPVIPPALLARIQQRLLEQQPAEQLVPGQYLLAPPPAPVPMR